ncbi:MAG: hypothetical protein K2R98_08150 [Gemmataceae bacterium]|nr:hypothetical protein [Gemmataceae bacterium]
MSTATDTPPAAPKPQLPPGDPDRPTGVVLPILLTLALIGAIGAGITWLFLYIAGLRAADNQDIKFVFRRLEESIRLGGREVDATLFWLALLIPILILGIVYVVWQYIRDGKQVGPFWAVFLAGCRCCVYLVLAGVFLLPALQSWEKSEAVSRVLILLDLSGSMNLADENPSEGRQPPTRLDQVVRFLSKDNGAFVKGLQDKNPVYVYAFGAKVDEDAKEIKRDGQVPSEDDWLAWSKMDVRQWVLDGLSEEGRGKVMASRNFTADQPANSIELANFWTNWFKDTDVFNELNEGDKEKLKKKSEELAKKMETRQQILTSTSYPDALLNLITRESNNMLAGIIVVGDGRSTAGSDSTLQEALNRANNIKVPIFTVGVGVVREQINIRNLEVQAPEMAPPDEKFMVRFEVDGEGLPDKEFEVFLDVYGPDQVVGKDKPMHTIPSKGKFKSAPGLIPHGQVEFVIDPKSKEAAPLLKDGGKSEGGTPELKEGTWKFMARVPRAKGEGFAKKEHETELPAEIQIVKRPLRVLLVSGGAGKDYQFTRRLFVNEMDKKRAEVSVYQQFTDPKGDRVLDVPNERLLRIFPNVYEDKKDNAKAEDRFYNLAMYDLIIAYDPDWTQVDAASLKLLEQWVDAGGGLIVLAGPINTYQLARGSNFEKLKPIIDLYPVKVEDSRLSGLSMERDTKKAYALNFPGATKDTEFLKLDDDSKYPLAGWSEFFYGKPHTAVQPSDTVQRGFHTFYPVKSAKPGATVVATFADPNAKISSDDGKNEEMPYLVTMPSKKGKVVYLGWEGMWRLRLFKEQYHERFWTKLSRFAGSGNMTRQTARGVPIMGRQFVAGQPIRFQAQLRQQNMQPLAKTEQPKLKLIPPAGVQLPKAEFVLEPQREGDWDGYFRTQFVVNAPGKYTVELPIPGSSETLRREFQVKESNPELDNSRPDFAAMEAMASEVGKLQVNESSKAALRTSLRKTARPAEGDGPKGDDPHLFFSLDNASVIPDYLKSDLKVQRSRGKIEDLWSAGPTFAEWGGSPVTISAVLLIVVFLLSAEWLTRKLLRLA